MRLPLPVTDGRIIFNARQTMPNEIPGYTQNPDDPYEWFMDYNQCRHREEGQKFVCTTGRTRVRDFCHLKKMKVHPPICKRCDCVDKKEPQPMTLEESMAGVGNELVFESVGSVDSHLVNQLT